MLLATNCALQLNPTFDQLLGLRQLGQRDLLRGHLQSLDARGGDRLGSEEEPGQALETARLRAQRQPPDRYLDVGRAVRQFRVE